jgi:hypothetical protein
LKSPSLANLGRVGRITDSTLTPKSARTLSRAGYWGGQYTISTGEVVTIFASDSYPQDPAIPQRWADFLGSLVHGSELSALRAYIAPLSEVQRFCGVRALACYSPEDSALVSPGEDVDSTSAEGVIAHEYGHHVAAHRSNAPWAAVAYGTKRWSSYQQVCARTRASEYFPGAEDRTRYAFNPGEGFAEAYRVLNQRRAGVPESAWEIVSRSFYPTDAALAALQQDVNTPWTANSATTVSGRLARKGASRTISIATPFDGTFRLTLRGAAKAKLSLQLLTASGVQAGRAAANRTLSTTICGSRTYRARIMAGAAAARYALTISKP